MKKISLSVCLLIPCVASATGNVYSGDGFVVDTGDQAMYQAAGLTSRPIHIRRGASNVSYFLFNRACRRDIYDVTSGKYITACSAMVLSDDHGQPGQQVGVVGFCNPNATTQGAQHLDQVMYMPVGGQQNCLYAAGHASSTHVTFSCPCHLPDS